MKNYVIGVDKAKPGAKDYSVSGKIDGMIDAMHRKIVKQLNKTAFPNGRECTVKELDKLLNL